MFTAIAQLQSEMDVMMRAATDKSPVLSELKTMKLHLSHMHEKVEDIVSICVDEEDKVTGYRLNSEHFLQQQLIKDAEKHLPYTQVYAQDWEVWPGLPHCGKGNFIFKRPGFEDYLVVETKYLTTNTGRVATNSRKKGRNKVYEQALRYGAAFKRLHPDADVEIATYTNESGLHMFAYYDSSSFNLHYHHTGGLASLCSK
jgi:hypothetical protein